MKSNTGIESLMEKNEENVFAAILTLTDKKSCAAFLGDLCSSKELKEIAKRFMIAKMLLQGCTYREIISRLNVANVTISRVKSIIER